MRVSKWHKANHHTNFYMLNAVMPAVINGTNDTVELVLRTADSGTGHAMDNRRLSIGMTPGEANDLARRLLRMADMAGKPLIDGPNQEHVYGLGSRAWDQKAEDETVRAEREVEAARERRDAVRAVTKSFPGIELDVQKLAEILEWWKHTAHNPNNEIPTTPPKSWTQAEIDKHEGPKTAKKMLDDLIDGYHNPPIGPSSKDGTEC
jgi:hypothetical protein